MLCVYIYRMWYITCAYPCHHTYRVAYTRRAPSSVGPLWCRAFLTKAPPSLGLFCQKSPTIQRTVYHCYHLYRVACTCTPPCKISGMACIHYYLIGASASWELGSEITTDVWLRCLSATDSREGPDERSSEREAEREKERAREREGGRHTRRRYKRWRQRGP